MTDSRRRGATAEVADAGGPHGAAPEAGALPMFDARYRWVLLFALRWLRETPDIDVDLDDPAHLSAAYECMSTFVQRYVVDRGLAARLDPMRVAAIAESAPARATVESILRRQLSSGLDDAARELIEKNASAPDPSLDPAAVERRARDRRRDFARAFGLHARIIDLQMSKGGGLRVHVAFDEDIAFAQDDLKALEINGVSLAGAQLVDVRRDEAGAPRVTAVIAVNVDKAAAEQLRAMPLKVTATTKDDVRVQAIKMA